MHIMKVGGISFKWIIYDTSLMKTVQMMYQKGNYIYGGLNSNSYNFLPLDSQLLVKVR